MALNVNGIIYDELTQAEIDALVNPPTGYTVFNSTTGRLQVNYGVPVTPDWNPASITTAEAEHLSAGGGNLIDQTINIVDNTATPPTEVSGDIYIIDDTGATNPAWDGASAWDVVKFDGTTWIAYTPKEGYRSYIETLSLYYRFDGSTWVLDSETVTPADMATLVVERTTDMALTGTYQEMTFDMTGLENDPAVLKHNDVNTEQIDVFTSGFHQVALAFGVTNSNASDQFLEAELRVDGTPVKTLVFEVTKTDTEMVARVTGVPFTANTVVTLAFRQQGGGTDLTIVGDTVFYITKMQGQKGDKGTTGAGANIIVQKDDVTVGTVTSELNFEGSAVTSVVDEGSNKTTVTIDGGGFTYLEQYSPTVATNSINSTWEQVNLPNAPINSTVQVLIEKGGNNTIGVRKVGSSLPRTQGVRESSIVTVNTDANGDIEIFASAISTTFRYFGLMS